MTGKALKIRIQKMESSMTEVAKKLGILPQALNQVFNAADVKTGFVENLASIYDKPISYFFEDEIKIEDNSRHDDHSARFGSKTEHYENSGNEVLIAKLKVAEDKIESLKEQLNGKDETIAALRSDIESKQKMIEYLMEKK